MLAGLRHGRTLGTPLALVVRNRDHENWAWGMSPWPPEGEPHGKGTKPVTLPRPGHADLAGAQKHGFDDVRDALERASARQTAVARRGGRGREGVPARARHHRRGRACSSAATSTPPARSATRSAASSRRAASGVPPGLGSYASRDERLDARLAAALMGIQAVKGVEIGDGFALARAARLGGARRDRAGPPPRHEPRGRDRGRRLERRGDRRPRRDEAAADAHAAAALRRPRDRARPPRRTSSEATSPQSRRWPSWRRRPSRSSSPARRGRSSAATRWSTSSAAYARVPRADRVGPARPPRRPDRLHGRGQERRSAARWRSGSAASSSISTTRSRRATGETVAELFEQVGEGGFRELEERQPRPARSRRDAARDRARRGRGRRPRRVRELLRARAVDRAGRRRRRRPPGSASRGTGRPLAQRRGVVPRAVRAPPAALPRARRTPWPRDARRRRPRRGRRARRDRRARAARLARARRGRGRARRRRERGRHPRRGRAARARRPARRRARAAERGGGEDARRLRAALARARARARRDARRARRRRDDRCRRLRRRRSPARDRRGSPVPTTLVGQVDAAIGGKTGVNLPEAKNRVGAFHWPVRTVVDPALLATLPAAERENGLAEVVKTGLLAGEPLWELPEPEQVRRAAAYKAAVCLQDPHERGRRAELNLGHTFAHALEAASDYELPHGRAVALGLLAALRLSGHPTDVGRGDSCGRSRSASTASARGRRSCATRRPTAARRGSSCSSGRASRGPASSSRSARFAPPSTR